LDDTIQFYGGATLTLNYEFRDPQNSTLPYAFGGAAVASIINSNLGFSAMPTITDNAASNVQVELPSGSTGTMTKRQRYSFQLKIDLCDVGIAGNPLNTVIILDPTEVMAI
jgi:hypothetical protein